YYSAGYQIYYENAYEAGLAQYSGNVDQAKQTAEQATKALDDGVERTLTQYHYLDHLDRKGAPRTETADGDNTADIWLEQPGDNPPATLTLDGVHYQLEKGHDGKPVSRRQPVRDVGGLNQLIARAYRNAEELYKPRYDLAGKLQTADPVTR